MLGKIRALARRAFTKDSPRVAAGRLFGAGKNQAAGVRDAVVGMGAPSGRVGRLAGGLMNGSTKAMAFATFAPLAAVGIPVMKAGGMGLGLGWKASKGLGKAGWNSLGTAVSSPGHRALLASSGALLGTGMAAGGQMSNQAERVQNRYRDPAGTMGLSQSLHNAHRRR